MLFQVWLSHPSHLSIKSWSWKSLFNSNESYWKMQSFVGGTLSVWHSAAAEFFLRASLPLLTDHNCQQRENVEHPCLMADEKGHFSSSILHWPAESLVDVAVVATAADNLVATRLFLFLSVSPQQRNRGFNPFPQVETVSSLISFSLSDGQAAWAVMEGRQTGQRWLSGIIPLWNPPSPLK